MITVFILTYNEQVMLPFTIHFYRERFPDCKIVLMDNESTDDTIKIAKENGCEIKSFNSKNHLSDAYFEYVKNNYYKSATTNWVVVCDADECLDINQEQLIAEEQAGTTLIRSKAYNMVNMVNNFHVGAIDHGYRNKDVKKLYDKTLMFDRSKISNICYVTGAHTCKPFGIVKMSEKRYMLRHYKFIHPDYMVERYKAFKERMSPINLEKGWGGQFLETEQTIRTQFEQYRAISKKII